MVGWHQIIEMVVFRNKLSDIWWGHQWWGLGLCRWWISQWVLCRWWLHQWGLYRRWIHHEIWEIFLKCKVLHRLFRRFINRCSVKFSKKGNHWTVRQQLFRKEGFIQSWDICYKKITFLVFTLHTQQVLASDINILDRILEIVNVDQAIDALEKPEILVKLMAKVKKFMVYWGIKWNAVPSDQDSYFPFNN